MEKLNYLKIIAKIVYSKNFALYEYTNYSRICCHFIDLPLHY